MCRVQFVSNGAVGWLCAGLVVCWLLYGGGYVFLARYGSGGYVFLGN